MKGDAGDEMVRQIMRREFFGRVVLAAAGSAIPMLVVGILVGVLLSMRNLR